MKRQFMFAIAFFFLLIIFAQNVIAEPPFETIIDFPDGYALIDNPNAVLTQNNDYQYNFFVYNKSNGVLIDNSSTNCVFFLADNNGEVIYFSEVGYFIDGHWGIDIDSGNFSRLGTYSYGTKCQDGDKGGALAGVWQATPTGTNPSTAQSLIYALLILASMFFLLVCLYGAFTIDGKNEFSMGGDLIRVNFNKYYKGFLFLIAYLFAIFTSFLTWQVSAQFLMLDLGTAIFKTIFNILWIGFFPIMILLIIIGFVKWLADVELHKLAERGLKPR